MRLPAIILLILAVGLTGCFHSREISSLGRDFSRMNPELRLRQNFVLNIGPGTMHLIERAAGAYDGHHPIDFSEYIRDIDRIKVGIYEVRMPTSVEDFTPSMKLPTRDGWSPVVIVRDGADATSVYYRETGRSIRDLLVITASTDQLVVVRLQGNLGRLLLRALDDRDRLMQRATAGRDDPTGSAH